MTQSNVVPLADASGVYTHHFRLARKPFGGGMAYACPAQEAALESLVQGLRQRRGVLVLTGEFGTGKTQLLRRLVQTMGQDWDLVLCYSTQLNFDELLGLVCDRLGLEVQGEGRPQRLKALKTYLRTQQEQGRGVALLVDEAQHLDGEVLNSLLNLARNGFRDGRSLELVLSGSIQLENRLAEQTSRHPMLEQAVLTRLQPLEPARVEDYIRQQIRQAGGDPALLFPPDAARQVARFARGRLRLINALCDRALLLAQLEGLAAVSVQVVEQAAAELLLEEQHEDRDSVTRRQPIVTATAPVPEAPVEATTPAAPVASPPGTQEPESTQRIAMADPPPGPGPEATQPTRRRRRRRRLWPWLVAGSAVAAAVAGYGLWPLLQSSVGTGDRVVQPVNLPQSETVREVVEERRQADPPRLVVAPAAGTRDQAIALDIEAMPGDERDTLTIDIAGLPRGAALSAGRQYSQDTWTLNPSELEGLKLYPAEAGESFRLTVTATAIPPFAGTSQEVSVTLPVSVDAGSVELPAPVVAEETPQAIDQAPAVVEEVPLVTEETPVVVDEAPAVDEVPSVAEEIQTVVNEAPVVVNETPVVTEEAPSLAEEFQTVVDEAPSVIEETPEVADETPSVIEETPEVADETPAVAAEVPLVQALPEEEVQEIQEDEEFAAVEPSPSVVAFMASGNRMMDQGDPAAARLFFEAAARTGDPRAATAVGMTYDPLEMQRREIRGAYADPLLAGRWYRQGLEGRDPEAEERLRDLRDWLLQHQGPDGEQLLALDRLLGP